MLILEIPPEFQQTLSSEKFLFDSGVERDDRLLIDAMVQSLKSEDLYNVERFKVYPEVFSRY